MAHCEPYRQALSARADGEPTDLDGARVEAHVAACAGCRDYATRLDDVTAVVARARTAPTAHDRTHELLTAMRTAPPRRSRPDLGLLTSRLALVAVACAQLLLVVVELATTDAVHSARDLGAFEIALAVGFLTAAVAPERAAALLPMAAALVVALAVVVGVDLAAGRATPGAEAAHMIEVIGVGLLWLVSRPPAWWQARPA